MTDISYIFLWWIALLGIGLIFFPVTAYFFETFSDRGYIFSKILGTAVVSFLVFLLGITHILPFTLFSVWTAIVLSAIGIYFFWRKKTIGVFRQRYKIILAEEIILLLTFAFWAYIRAHQPDIHGLEKFMDYGFINSLLRSTYFPPKDMWFPPYSINYYYFGHLVTAVLIRLTQIPPQIGFNLMVATIFGMAFTGSFSIGINLTTRIKLNRQSLARGILAAFLLTLGGNLHTIYTLFTPYKTDSPVPPWQLIFSPGTYPNSYWYANATRFIPYTIHEFPSYSFVVADLHGHVLDIPFVLLSLALLLAFYKAKKTSWMWYIVFSFMLAVMYMTNAWDGIIYFGAGFLLFLLKSSDILNIKKIKMKKKLFPYRIENVGLFIQSILKQVGIMTAGFVVFVLPFSLFFKPFVSGIGVICAPSFLTRIGKIGPFLFEADHCQRSPLWQLAILYGFFYIMVFIFIGWLLKKKKMEKENMETFILLLILLSTMLIIVPEFLYAKDIYPQYYRANTMFKLVYQAFMMLSLCSAYIIAKMVKTKGKYLFIPLVAILFVFIFVFPYFAVSSYYQFPPPITSSPCNSILPQCTLKVAETYISADQKNYKSLDGIAYLKLSAPDDWNTINWINKNIKGQPVILEAQGDSYTDYERLSSYTGLPTVLGWTVHEWLWRGTYDIPAPRIAEVNTMYTSTNMNSVKSLLKKYTVKYVYVGNLERQKYPTLTEIIFKKLGTVIYHSGNSRLYKLKI